MDSEQQGPISLEVGMRIGGRYRIEKRLGSGAMAEVFAAIDEQINRRVAIKFLHPELCLDGEMVSRFEQEARAAGSLSHRNIVTVYDVGNLQAPDAPADEDFDLLDAEPDEPDPEDLPIQASDELLELYIEESQNLLDSSQQALDSWRRYPRNQADVYMLRQNLHTLKGSSRMAGLNELGDLIHAGEIVIETFVDRTWELDPGFFELIQRLLDRLKAAVQRLASREPITRDGPVETVSAALRGYLAEAELREAAAEIDAADDFPSGHHVSKRPYIVMEFVEGDPLSSLLKQGQRYSEIEVVEFATQIADALDSAHRVGLVHRDIKPANILVERTTGRLKITDFGIARMTDPEARDRTAAGTMVGTPQYMSPEQLNDGDIDGRSDLFSLGVVLYQLAAGQSPFDGGSVSQLIANIMTKPFKPLKEVAPQTSAGLVRIIERLLAKDPRLRFQSGAELREALSEHLDSLREAREQRNSNRVLPIRATWPAVMAISMAVVMVLAARGILWAQNQVFTELAGDSGAAVANVVAFQSVLPMIAEEYSEMRIFVDQISEKPSFAYIHLADAEGIIRASSEPALLGDSYVPDVASESIGDFEGVRVSAIPGGEHIDFRAPLEAFESAHGTLYMGISRDALASAQREASYLVYGLSAVTVLMVALIGFIGFSALSRPIRTTTRAMRMLSHGKLDYRILQRRRDEFGRLFSEFNTMADALAKQREVSLAEARAESDAAFEDSAALDEARAELSESLRWDRREASPLDDLDNGEAEAAKGDPAGREPPHSASPAPSAGDVDDHTRILERPDRR